jgi:squalene-hopene/tetraprenyl-beta-curcumene cyclase
MALAERRSFFPEAESDDLGRSVERARVALLAAQRPDGCWSYPLEADCTIPAEYVLLEHFLGEIQPDLEEEIGAFLRARQDADGGWPLYAGGAADVSCSVRAYFALKLIGDDPAAPHMRRARLAILAAGGAARANVFTRITLALFEQVPWRAVPFMPPEIMLLPRWSPLHISRVSYWSRTVMVPLFVIVALKPKAANPRGVDVRELFTVAPESERGYFRVRSTLNRLIHAAERLGRRLEPLIPGAVRRRAIARAEAWFTERCRGEGGLGAIFPAMVNAYLAMLVLGYDRENPLVKTQRRAIDALLVEEEAGTYCQPCASPVWDTGLACLALLETSRARNFGPVRRALDWLRERQLLSEPGDWRETHPGLAGGGWAFQFENAYYPDLDDTAVVAWAMHAAGLPERYGDAIRRAADWICGMQSRNGGFAAFDSDNTAYYLNEIPFADHGALLDPPTGDVSARCVTLLARLGRASDGARLHRALDFLRSEQEHNGSWFGRWGSNYIYGTWSVLVALAAVPETAGGTEVRRAVRWLEDVQHADGGWGEHNDSYLDPDRHCASDESTAFQTAWALLALMAAGRVRSRAVRRGIDFLLERQGKDGLWHDRSFTAPGFPRVFYLKYHGYNAYFPLWALARYRNLIAAEVRGGTPVDGRLS